MTIIVTTPNGEVLAEGILNESVFLIEGNYYFDKDKVNMQSFKLTGKTYTCPIKQGTCDYYDLIDPNTSTVLTKEIGWIYESIANTDENLKRIEHRMAFYKNKGLEIMQLNEI
jgi:uncharacterized protein (DUF427 family)